MAFVSPKLSLLFICCYLSLISAQQPYVGKDTTNCGVTDVSKSDLGYLYNGLNSSCQAYLSFRSLFPYNNVTSISSLLSADPSQVSAINNVSQTQTLETNQLLLIPINCSNSGQFYQSNTSFLAETDDTIFTISNNTYQGLTTCQAMLNQSGNSSTTKILAGQTLNVPLRCACPTKNQTDDGVKYLLSYLVQSGDYVSTISENFGVTTERTLEANQQTPDNAVLYPFTTLLVPLEEPPSVSQTISPPSPPSSPPPPPPSSSSGTKSWIYILVGVIAGVFVIISTVFCLFLYRRKKKSDPSNPNMVSETFEAYDVGKKFEADESEDFLESVSSIAQFLKVYKYQELVSATDNFSPSCWIKGSVYRGNFHGDLAAIKKTNGDVTKEINLLSTINHSNLIRLSGVCYHDGNWYLVYEYAANGALAEWIYDGNSKVLNWTQRMAIALDVARGLDYLHSFATPPHVHKDIKSSNILLDGNMRGKIANFALARLAEWEEEGGEFALTRRIVGTKGYMAPEYLEHGLVSTKLDVYSFGILMMELVTGKEATEFNGDEKTKLSDLLRDEEENGGDQEGLKKFIDPSLKGKYPSDLAKFMIRLIDRCIKKDPTARPGMDEIVQSLSRIVDSSLAFQAKP
ncbi:lysM domain receptor-like kinase 4 [Rutidosis leptorrhynchoides]|uniref:lysM domain receptor-like kinase 4 n=1 Tax=Rutidosis leptorrhynchoides TaxID=125765 RepID=UPI003A98FB37